MDYRAGMFVYALAFLLGDIFVQQLKVLPDHFSLVLILISVCLLFVVFLIVKKLCNNGVLFKVITLCIFIISLFLLGISYASLYARYQLSNRLDANFVGKSLVVTGIVSSIPAVNGHVQRFTFTVEGVQDLTLADQQKPHVESISNFPGKIRLSWYYGRKVNAAEKWQFEVRLKPPHGFMNPAGFDYESWLFQQGLDATGYVRKSELNQKINGFPKENILGSIDHYRQILSRLIDSIADKRQTTDINNSAQIDSFPLVKALAIGDKSSISNEQWQVLIKTGTSHLMAISGLHIGLSALFAYVVIRRLIPAFVTKRVPAQHIALAGGLFIALLYALIAGLSIPTQRAIIMLFVVSMMMLLRRNHRPLDALGFALFIVLIIDPLAVLSVGFWFSFAAVAVIFISLGSDSSIERVNNNSVVSKSLSTLKQWVKLQLTISVFLLPLSLFMFQQVSIISPIANFLLIPYVSFLVVPVVLLALVSVFVLPAVGESLFILAANMVDFVWPALTYLSVQPYALWVQGEVGIAVLFLATMAIAVLYVALINRGNISINAFKNRIHHIIVITFSLALLFTLTGSDSALGEYKVTVLDVGQGSSAVLQTQHHTIVFDAGAKFSEKLDAGSSVVIPYLRSRGVSSLDYLIISHGDNDHIGGAQAIIDEYTATTVLGQDIGNLRAANKQDCYEGLKWQWDGVEFEFLSPPQNKQLSSLGVKRNNRSCVLHVTSEFGSVLFTGDAEKSVERRLLDKYAERLASDVLVVPHHGSNTSSSSAFIETVDPDISLFSVGYKNRYKLPSKKVLNRYVSSNSAIMQTDKSGAITIKFTDENGIVVTKYREKAGKYWNHIIN